MEEEWRDIKNYEGLYQVSNYGRVKHLECFLNGKNGTKRNVKEHILSQKKRKSGYHEVNLFNNNKSESLLVHRLVAFAFPDICGEYFEGAEVNHKDENPENNIALNLEWCTHSYNINYGNRTCKCIKKTSKTVLQYSLDGKFIKEWESLSEIGRVLDAKSIGNISSCCLNRKHFNTAYGFKWEYK